MENIFVGSTAYPNVQKWFGWLCKIVSCFHWKESIEGSVAHQRNEKEDSLHFQWSFASCSSTNVCVMAFVFLMSQLIFLDENIEKIRQICLLATYTTRYSDQITSFRGRNHCLWQRNWLWPSAVQGETN